jgi:hypothetical protein
MDLQTFLVNSILALLVAWRPVAHPTRFGPLFEPDAPHGLTERVRDRVAAIDAAAAGDREIAAQLAVIDFYETTLGARGVPFGACAHLCHHHCGDCRTEPLADTARWAATVLRGARTGCGPSFAMRLGYYHHGTTCVADEFSRREAARVRTMLRAWEYARRE